jgi:glycosyltransferase involved in cell wall biosynthesis
MDKQPLLSICVPIYNRKIFLERMLSSFLEDKQLFQNDIQLYISDNCSTEDVKGVADFYYSIGLNLEYHCNDRNLGMDGNFINCLNHANGKYTWLLGSDDVPVKGLLIKLLKILKEKDYGLLHLSDRDKERFGQIVEYKDSNQFCEDLHVWITFISGNVVRTNKLANVDLNKFIGTLICQVPLYLNSILTSPQNAIYYDILFEKENDFVNNGGYNIFEVFVTNLYGIYKIFVRKDLLSKHAFNRIKKIEYKEFLIGYIIQLLIFRKKNSFKIDGCWIRLLKYYGGKPYGYYYLMHALVKTKVRKFSQ